MLYRQLCYANSFRTHFRQLLLQQQAINGRTMLQGVGTRLKVFCKQRIINLHMTPLRHCQAATQLCCHCRSVLQRPAAEAAASCHALMLVETN